MTNIAPPKLLSIYLRTQEITDHWPGQPGVDDAAGEPRQWRFIADVNAQLHSSHNSIAPMQYDARDIKVGDYITTGSNGRYLVIDEIINLVTTGQIEFKASDEDKINAITDYTQYADGSLIDSPGFLFETKNQMPVLFPLPDVLPAGFTRGFATQIMSRFTQRGKHDTLQVFQAGHGFSIGQAIVLNSNGVYAPANFTTDISQDAKRVIGVVEETNYPTDDYFRIRTVGPVIDIELADGGPGQLYFLDNSSSGGQLANFSPNSVDSQSAGQPIYIKIDNKRAVFNPAGSLDVSSISSSFVVDTLTDLQNVANPSDGDTAYVHDIGNGDWGFYIYDAGQWVLMQSESASAVDARSFERLITHLSANTTVIYKVSGLVRVVNVSLKITTPFDNGATITVGDQYDNSRYMTEHENDTSLVGEYQSFPSHIYAQSQKEDVNVYLNANGATQGEARVLITYV
jgi:hypothetical protein